MKTLTQMDDRIDELFDDSSKVSCIARETLEEIVKHLRKDIWGPDEVLAFAKTTLEITGGIQGALIAATCGWALDIPGSEFMNVYPLQFTFEHIPITNELVKGHTIGPTLPPCEPKLRSLWRTIKSRCKRENIPFHEPWVDYDVFATEVGPRQTGKRLMRINTDLGYVPNNVEWR